MGSAMMSVCLSFDKYLTFSSHFAIRHMINVHVFLRLEIAHLTQVGSYRIQVHFKRIASPTMIDKPDIHD